jgi:hypothetical protein
MEGLARPAWWPCCSPPMPSSSSANTIWRKTALFWLPLQEIVRLQVEKDVLDTQSWLMTHLTNSLNFGSQSLLDSSAAVIEGDAFLAAIASAPSPVATIKERHDNEKLLPTVAIVNRGLTCLDGSGLCWLLRRLLDRTRCCLDRRSLQRTNPCWHIEQPHPKRSSSSHLCTAIVGSHLG